VDIARCPHELVGADVWELLRFCDLVDRGHLPRRGAPLDQTQSFMDALSAVTVESNRMERSILNGSLDAEDPSEGDE
jgi:hypothetical protein